MGIIKGGARRCDYGSSDGRSPFTKEYHPCYYLAKRNNTVDQLFGD